jgi:fatty acid desaturase
MGALHRACRRALTMAAGRLLLGPPYYVARAWLELLRRMQAGDWPYLRNWAIHVPAVALVLVWVIAVCRIPFWQYLLLYVWPGLSLTLFRSYLEHQARAEVGHRTVVVEAGPLMSLVYLNNNLHALHHLEPAAAWHQRQRRYREIRDDVLRWNGGYRYSGYGEILARYLLRPKEPVVHPLGEV